jgi:hypothetical protein
LSARTLYEDADLSRSNLDVLYPERTLWLVQSSVGKHYMMKAKLGRNFSRKMFGFLFIPCSCRFVLVFIAKALCLVVFAAQQSGAPAGGNGWSTLRNTAANSRTGRSPARQVEPLLGGTIGTTEVPQSLLKWQIL